MRTMKGIFLPIRTQIHIKTYRQRFGSVKRYLSLYSDKGKGKAFPLQAWTGPVVSRKLRVSDFKTIGT